MEFINNKDRAFLLRAIDAMQNTTGVRGQVVEWGPTATEGVHAADARVEIEVNGHRYIYAAELKRIDRFAILAEFKNRKYADQLLLIAPRVTTEIADKCRELDLQFIDAAGNAYLRQPGLYVLVKGQRPIEGEDIRLEGQEGKRTGTATALRIVFALLCKPALFNAPYRNINQMAGVALGAVGWIFFDLNERGYTTGGKGKGDRVLLERQRLVQEWITNYPIKLRPKLNPRRFRAPKADWWKAVDVAQYGAQWGAEVAAEKLTGYLRPHMFTLYLHNEQGQRGLTKMVAEHRLRQDPQGDIEILDAFWNFEDEKPMPETVPPILVYADLLATLDPRNLEAAQLIYERYIATDTKG